MGTGSDPIIRSKWTDEHPSGGTPRAANGVEKVASFTATMASQRVAEVKDAPTMGPFAQTMIGFGKSRYESNKALKHWREWE